MRKLLILPRARLDLLEIWHYLAKESLPAAQRVGDELDAAIRDLVTMPGKGHKRSEAGDERIRFWSVYSYLIIYRYDDSQLTVVRVVHGKRDLKKLLRRRT